MPCLVPLPPRSSLRLASRTVPPSSSPHMPCSGRRSALPGRPAPSPPPNHRRLDAGRPTLTHTAADCPRLVGLPDRQPPHPTRRCRVACPTALASAGASSLPWAVASDAKQPPHLGVPTANGTPMASRGSSTTSSCSSNSKPSASTGTPLFAVVPWARTRDNCYYSHCCKDANCACEICLAGIDATQDLVPALEAVLRAQVLCRHRHGEAEETRALLPRAGCERGAGAESINQMSKSTSVVGRSALTSAIN